MSAPAFGNIGTHQAGTFTTMSVAVPTGVTSGDIIVIPIYLDSTFTITALPSGFAEAENSPVTVPFGFGGPHSLHVVWKRATGADAGTYSFTFSGSAYSEASAARYTGCVTTGSPWDSPTSAAFTTTNVSASPNVSVTTNGPDRMLVFAATNWGGGSWTPPTGFTERMDTGVGVNTLDDLVQSVAGSSGNVSATSTSTNKSTAWLGALIGQGPPPVAGSLTVATKSPTLGPVSGSARLALKTAGGQA